MRINLTENNSETKLIPEGITTFKIMTVDASDYESFGRITVRMQTQNGKTHFETYHLKRADGSANEGALKAWSYFVRIVMQTNDINSVDTDDLVGRYVTARVEHETYTLRNGDHAGEERTAERLKDLQQADGFPVKAMTGYGYADLD